MPQWSDISIHALREEGDQLLAVVKLWIVISIHALREEGDLRPASCTGSSSGFLSTPSARRATVSGNAVLRYIGISIHALREEGDLLELRGPFRFCISIHALREVGDLSV